MARIAVGRVSEGTRTALGAAARAHDFIDVSGNSSHAEADLLVVEVARGDRDWLSALPASPRPVLVLLERGATMNREAVADRPVFFLAKPFHLVDLKLQIEKLLDVMEAEPSAGDPWMSTPLLTAEASSALAAARRLGGAVWIVGEAGTGCDRAAVALARCWDASRSPAVWAADQTLAQATAQLDDRARVLWAPAVEERARAEQIALERFLALEPHRRVVVTSADEPALAVSEGRLTRGLHDALSRLALRLPPLRERGRDIPVLAAALAGPVAADLGLAGLEITDEAQRLLAAYDWPGNVRELDAVLVRSLAELAALPGASPRRLGPGDLRLAADLWPSVAEAAQSEDAAAPSPSAPRRAVVVTMDAARGARPSDIPSAVAPQVPESPALVATESSQDGGIEALLAAFAHDIRNPMATLKTFAELQAAAAAEGDAELAGLAVAACARIGDQLEFLQRFGELEAASPGTGVAVDLVDTLGEAADADDRRSPALGISARRPLWARVDADSARFIADVIVAECRARQAAGDAGTAGGSSAVADLATDGQGLEIRIPVGGAAVDRLDKWVAGRGLPWRLALARQAARRLGGDIETKTVDGQLSVLWRAPLAEERRHDDEAGSPDRRRRSRSS